MERRMSSPFSTFESTVAKAVEDGALPGAVLIAKDKSGKINYAKAIGSSSLKPGAEKPMDTTTIFALMSMTKLLTSIAACQLIESGKISPDTNVAPYLPALASQPILLSIDDSGKPVTASREKPILVRHLLTHSSGAAYNFFEPMILQWQAANETKSVTGPAVVDRYNWPLLFEPGTSWKYGSSTDWAGRLVEVVSGQDLETYITENILNPLNIPAGAITFYPERFPDLYERHATVSSRDAGSGRVVYSETPFVREDKTRHCYGGEGAFADLSQYIKVLHSLLVDDGKLLRPETASKLLFEPMLDKDAKEAIQKEMKNPWWIVGHIPDTGEYDHSLGGVLTDGDSHQHRRRGFLQWGGAYNLAWFIDRTAGVCGIFGTQILQPADPLVEPLIAGFEEAIYAKL
ncbi:beta-lactamase/transpeptidase-like protein [Apodospora peruviana]|uniref:Beta-lactamase/transpeptidase-like protein n=1 Tax=Apodospora peruviana TaxID=516989 RepID=A0AAE0HYZ6_9PEZI|nr:beta-lactamase/transpeptidase-like protein [Apodospora peruviana]